jgi:2'-5' RNA ligase
LFLICSCFAVAAALGFIQLGNTRRALVLDIAMDQISFDFGAAYGPRPRSRKVFKPHRLFFAIQPTAEVKKRARQIEKEQRAEHGIKAPERAAELMHVSVTAIGDYDQMPDGIVSLARQIAENVACTPMKLTFDRFMSFKNKRDRQAFVLCGEGGKAELMRLHVQLGVGLRNAGIKAGIGDFLPHMTLLYDRTSITPTALETPISWTADEFVLIHSLIGKAKHEIIDRWTLKG